MTLVVKKYGGTSVADPERIRRVAGRVVATADSGNGVCVVVSAMGHMTDELVELAEQVSPSPHPRERDMLLTAGEQISIALLSMAINDLGREAVSFTGLQAGIVTLLAFGGLCERRTVRPQTGRFFALGLSIGVLALLRFECALLGPAFLMHHLVNDRHFFIRRYGAAAVGGAIQG